MFSEHALTGQIASIIFAGSQYQIQSEIALFLKTLHVCLNQFSLKTDSQQYDSAEGLAASG